MKNRREILKASAAFMGVLGAFGLLGANAFATDVKVKVTEAKVRRYKGDSKTLKLILDDALKTGDMGKVLPKYEAKISSEQEAALAKLTPADLKVLLNIKDKLGDLKDRMNDHEGGIIY